jgi:ATP-dependent RNA helicase DDX60
VHPYAALAVATGTFPPDLALDSSDCWDLFSVMDSVATKCKRDDIIKEVRKLRPDLYFKDTPYIKTSDMIKFEASLRGTMERWIETASCKDLVAGVIFALGGQIDRQVKVMETSHADTSPYAREEYGRSLLPLLNQLNSADKLPALVFNFDRDGIEKLAQDLVSSLESAENVWKAGNTAWQKKFETWQKWEGDAKARQKREDLKAKSSKSKTAEEEAREKEGSWLDTFDPSKPQPQFSFHSPRAKVAGQELEDDIADLTRWNDIPHWLTSMSLMSCVNFRLFASRNWDPSFGIESETSAVRP